MQSAIQKCGSPIVSAVDPPWFRIVPSIVSVVDPPWFSAEVHSLCTLVLQCLRWLGVKPDIEGKGGAVDGRGDAPLYLCTCTISLLVRPPIPSHPSNLPPSFCEKAEHRTGVFG